MFTGWRHHAALLLLVSVACVSRSPASRADGRGVSVESNARVTAVELSRYADGQSLLEALRRLRPVFLVGRGSPPAVSVDGSPAGDQSILDLIRASEVFEVRLVKAGSPESRSVVRSNGDVVVSDLIVVRTRKR